MPYEMQMGGLRCNKGGCHAKLPPTGSRSGWVTYCSHLFCDPCGRECATQGVCLACQTDLSPTGHREPAKISRVNLAPNNMEKQMMLAGMHPSDILNIAKAGIQFFEHQRELEVKLMRLRIAKQDKKLDAARQFNEEVGNHYKSQITKLELEKEDLRREKEELRREMSQNIHKAQLGVGGAQSLQLSLQYNGQVEDDSPTIGEQANQITAFDPDVEEIELEELDMEDFAPSPSTNSHRDNLQADMGRWNLNQSTPFLGSGAKRMSGAKRGLNMQEDNLMKGKRGRIAPATSPMRLF